MDEIEACGQHKNIPLCEYKQPKFCRDCVGMQAKHQNLMNWLSIWVPLIISQNFIA